MIPFSVALEERLAALSPEELEAEVKATPGASSALGKITQAGYSSLEVRVQTQATSNSTNSITVNPILHLRP